MARKFYTIFVLPHAHARFRRFHVSRNFLIVSAAVLAVVIATSALTPQLFIMVRSRAAAIANLEEENRKLKNENVRFEASLSRLGAQLDAFEAGARRLASAVGLSDLPGLRTAGGKKSGAVSAPGARALIDEEFRAIEARADGLDRSLEAINVKWEERLRLLRSTPSAMPVLGSFSDGFGWRNDPFTNEPEFHKGLDIVAPSGTRVQATADGVVTRVGRTAGYGKMVQISHGYGLATLYGHLSEILVRPGQRVHRGDVLGRVGSTGRSTGPHVHYEVYRSGRAVDPRKFLADSRY